MKIRASFWISGVLGILAVVVVCLLSLEIWSDASRESVRSDRANETSRIELLIRDDLAGKVAPGTGQFEIERIREQHGPCVTMDVLTSIDPGADEQLRVYILVEVAELCFPAIEKDCLDELNRALDRYEDDEHFGLRFIHAVREYVPGSLLSDRVRGALTRLIRETASSRVACGAMELLYLEGRSKDVTLLRELISSHVREPYWDEALRCSLYMLGSMGPTGLQVLGDLGGEWEGSLVKLPVERKRVVLKILEEAFAEVEHSGER